MIHFRLTLKNFGFWKAPLARSRKFGEDIRASLSVAQCIGLADGVETDEERAGLKVVPNQVLL